MSKAGLPEIMADWLGRLTANENPGPTIIAFNVGLFETNDGFAAYLIGAERFDPSDGDWACEPSFAPQSAYLALPRSLFAEPSWSRVQDEVTAAVAAFLTGAVGRASFFGSAAAVTVGFDDGDLVMIVR